MVKSVWFAAIHDVVPTNDKIGRHPPDGHKLLLTVQRTGLYSTQNCRMCGGTAHLDLDEAKLGMILRMDPRHIPPDGTIRLAFQYWSPRRQAALLRIVAHLVYYGLQSSRRLSLKDFMRRARCKAHRRSCRHPNTGTYLDLL